MDTDQSDQILEAVNRRADVLLELTAELTRFASTRGNETGVQEFVAQILQERGFEVDRWNIDVEAISSMRGFSPVTVSYDDAVNVVGTWRSRQRTGRSLILNGHVDVVPEGPLDMWDSPPYEPRIDQGWMYGRGAGDMKAGVAAMIVALDALADLGYRPAADVFLQSVIEEECTGNGALACLQRGYRADAAIIPEPLGEALVSAQVGVIWFSIRVTGVPVHVLAAGSGSNAIEATLPLIDALHRLEAEWNSPERRNPHFAEVEHPLNLNIGTIRGGDWASSVPAWCEMECRMGIFPDQSIGASMAEIEACIRTAAKADPMLSSRPPQLTFTGFLAEGYALADDHSQAADDAMNTLARAHLRSSGAELSQGPTTATTDARFFGLYGGTPALVYGPVAERIHGFNEAVELESVRRVCQTIALFVADWCGLEPHP